MTKTKISTTDDLIHLAGQLAEMFSFNRSIGQIYGCLYLSPEPLSLDEIAKRCHMSKGNASIHLRTLNGWGAVHLMPQLGTRRDFYRAELDLVELAARRVQEGTQRRIAFLRQNLDQLKNDLPSADSPAQQAYWKERIQDIDKMISRVEKAYPLLMKYMELRSLF